MSKPVLKHPKLIGEIVRPVEMVPKVQKKLKKSQLLKKFRLPIASLNFVMTLVGVLAISLLLLAFLASRNEVSRLKNNPLVSSDIVAQIPKIIDLPVEEQPTLVTVSDVEKLKGQSFFNRAENKDIVILYSKSQIAVLYRPSSSKIIQISPISSATSPANSQ